MLILNTFLMVQLSLLNQPKSEPNMFIKNTNDFKVACKVGLLGIGITFLLIGIPILLNMLGFNF